MEKFTVEEFQKRFDELLERVESGESFQIYNDNNEVVIVRTTNYDYIVDSSDSSDYSDEELIRIHTDHEEGS
jgi:hypothetical protein